MGKQKYKAGQAKKKEQQWEYVPMDSDLFTDNKEFENLISFEVLEDYQINKQSTATVSSDSAGEDETLEPMSKKAKKKLKKQMKAEAEVDSESDEEEVVVKKPNAKKGKETEPTRKEKQLKKVEPKAAAAKLKTQKVEAITEKDTKKKNKQQEKVSEQAASSSPPAKRTAKDVKPVKNKKQKLQVEETEFHVDSSQSEEEELPADTFSLESWAKLGVPEIVLSALREKGFDNPTSIQNLTLPAAILGKKDVVGAAETGSGKTLAFAIPIINGILNDRQAAANKASAPVVVSEDSEGESEDEPEHDGLRALILTPTRELAVQIKNHIDAISKYADISVVVIVGGLSQQKQERLLGSKPEIVIATPGRLWELTQAGNPHLSTLNRIRYLAIDETDRMVERGHFHELQGILNVLNSDPDVQAERQNFVFSATLSFTHEPPQRLKETSSKVKKNKKQAVKLTSDDKLHSIMEMIGVKENAKVVDITSGKGTCETLVEMSISCQLSQKDYYLYYFFICHPGRTIVFCNSINCVRRLVNLFFLMQCEPLALHSEMVQKQRLRSLERFAANDKGILIATDVAARGLDITNIEHVIHYQVPRTAESYIHRSGRTARAFKGGLALVLVEPAETTAFWNISRSLGRDEPLPSFKVDGEVFREIKARVDLGIKVEKFEHQYRKKFADISWAEKARKDMDLASSDEDSDRDIGGKQASKEGMRKAKTELEAAKAELAQLISTNSLLYQKRLDISAAFKKTMTTAAESASVSA